MKVKTDLAKYYENSSFFWTLSGVVKPSPSMGFRFRVSGFRLALAFSLLTPDTWVPVSNFHAISRQLKSHSYFSELNDEVWIRWLIRSLVKLLIGQDGTDRPINEACFIGYPVR